MAATALQAHVAKEADIFRPDQREKLAASIETRGMRGRDD